jgi:putative SOS response-associated peptidase YedK
MCSRYSLTSPPEAVRAYFGYSDTPNFPARYNVAPTQVIGVVALDKQGVRRFRLMRWGLLPQRPLGGSAGEAVLQSCHALQALPRPGRRLL